MKYVDAYHIHYDTYIHGYSDTRLFLPRYFIIRQAIILIFRLDLAEY